MPVHSLFIDLDSANNSKYLIRRGLGDWNNAFQPLNCWESTELANPLNLGYDVNMESITKNVRDISLPDKLALEHVIGQHLAENQQVIIQI